MVRGHAPVASHSVLSPGCARPPWTVAKRTPVGADV